VCLCVYVCVYVEGGGAFLCCPTQTILPWGLNLFFEFRKSQESQHFYGIKIENQKKILNEIEFAYPVIVLKASGTLDLFLDFQIFD